MAKLKYYSTKQIVEFFLEQGKEGECWDFKQEWHENMTELIKDIICFANTVHDENCYLIFGVSDDLKIVGMKKARLKQAAILDTLTHLVFAGDIIPQIEVQTIEFDGIEIDVLIIHNLSNPPVYLKRAYGAMREGCIYVRNGDKNTPDNSNADIKSIENLWRKRLGLTKPPLEMIFDCMHNKLEWKEQNEVFYNIYHPEYVLEILQDEEDLEAEFYSYAMPNAHTSYRNLNIKYQNTILETYQLVVLDGGRLTIPVPEWGTLCHDNYGLHPKCYYKYYVLGNNTYRLLSFLYDRKNGEERFAFMHLKDVVVFYHSDEERLAFESFVESHQETLNSYLQTVTTYTHINTGEATKTKCYIERLQTSAALNKLLADWRNKSVKA